MKKSWLSHEQGVNYEQVINKSHASHAQRFNKMWTTHDQVLSMS